MPQQGNEVQEEQAFWEAYAAASAKILNLSLSPDWEAAIAANLETLFKMAALVDGFKLPDDFDPVPVFEA